MGSNNGNNNGSCKKISVSNPVHMKLKEIRKRGHHTSIDSVIRELFMKAGEKL